MLVKIEARILIFPGTDFHFPSTSVPQGTFLGSATNSFLNSNFSILVTSNYNTVSECCLIKLLPYILFEKYICILALEMASPGDQHCADCIGTRSFPVYKTTGLRSAIASC